METSRRGFSLCESNVFPNKGDCGAFVMSDRKALARALAARTTPRFIEIKEEKRDQRPIILGPNEMRNIEKERERLIRLFDEDCVVELGRRT